MKKLFRKLFYHRYFVSYWYSRKEGYGMGQCVAEIKNKIRSSKEIEQIRAMLFKENMDATNIIILNWQHLE